MVLTVFLTAYLLLGLPFLVLVGRGIALGVRAEGVPGGDCSTSVPTAARLVAPAGVAAAG